MRFKFGIRLPRPRRGVPCPWIGGWAPTLLKVAVGGPVAGMGRARKVASERQNVLNGA